MKLSKRIINSSRTNQEFCLTKDVKQAIKEFKDKQKELMKKFDYNEISWVEFVSKMLDTYEEVFGANLI